jgi:hypothetical protein
MSMIFDDFDAELGPEEFYDRDELETLWDEEETKNDAQAFVDPDDYSGGISLSDFLARLPAEEQRKIHERAAELQRDLPF